MTDRIRCLRDDLTSPVSSYTAARAHHRAKWQIRGIYYSSVQCPLERSMMLSVDSGTTSVTKLLPGAVFKANYAVSDQRDRSKTKPIST